jgi:Fur family ferric uptake transcriptional regulator
MPTAFAFPPLPLSPALAKHLARFNTYLRHQGLRNTQQRVRIAEVFLAGKGHLSAEELYERLRAERIEVGQATVYRTLKHLCAAGLARELNFDDGIARYEKHPDEHHDHLICEICHRQIEVVDAAIERLQIELAQRHGFLPTHHRLNLYGICPDCRQSSEKKPEKDV